MATKPIYWVSMARWMSLTVEEHRRLDQYVHAMNMELGIDVVGDRVRLAADFQKDHDESKETSGGPGA